VALNNLFGVSIITIHDVFIFFWNVMLPNEGIHGTMTFWTIYYPDLSSIVYSIRNALKMYGLLCDSN
jgi:hypothetical protein